MNGSANAVGLIGAGLVAADFWTRDRATISAGLSGKTGARGQTEAHAALKRLGVEAAAVLVAIIVAGFSPSAGGTLVAVMLALALVWAMRTFGSSSNGGS